MNRIVWMQTSRGRGLNLLTDYLNALHQIYLTLSGILGLALEKNDSIMDQSNDDEFDMPKEDPIEKWYNRQCSKINLNPVKTLIRNQFKSICLLDNEQQLKTPSEPSSRLGAVNL